MKFKYRIGDIVYCPVDEGGSYIKLYPARIIALHSGYGRAFVSLTTMSEPFKIYDSVYITDLVPINLTQKMLIPFGFKKGPDPYMFRYMRDDRRFVINIDWEDQSVRIYKAAHIALDFVFIDFLHELQHIMDDWSDKEVSIEAFASYLPVRQKRKLHGTDAENS